jgi:tetratricopeptide (TPR) repeat protein
MPIRAKTKKRVIILGIVFLTAGTALGGAYLVRKQIIRRQMLTARADGLAQVAKGQYHEGLTSLGKYLGRYPTDVEALYSYIEARRHVEEPDGSQVGQTIGLLRRLLDLDPGNDKARRELMDLYLAVGLATEALQTADQFLAKNPDDPKALRVKTLALVHLRRNDQAVAAVRKLSALQRGDVETSFLLLMVLRAADAPPQSLLAEADGLLAAQPENPNLILLKGYAHQLNNQVPEASACYRRVAAAPSLDKETTARLAHLLDSVGQFTESLALLESRVPALGDPALRIVLAHRLLQADRLADLLKLTEDSSPDQASSDSQ